jgi:MFS family permease
VRDPLLPPGFVVEPRRLGGLFGIFLAAAGVALVTFLLSLHLQQQMGWSALATTGAFVPFTAALIATNLLSGRLVGRYGAGSVTVAGLVIGAAGLALLTGVSPDGSFALTLLPGVILLPVGATFVFSGSAVLSTANVPQHQAGLAGGVMNTAMELGPTVGLAALMAAAAAQAEVVVGYAWAFGAGAAVYLLVAILAAAALRRPVS